MNYTVELHEKSNKNMQYEITDVEATNEEEAAFKAKKFVAKYAYFPKMSMQQVMMQLAVDKVTESKRS